MERERRARALATGGTIAIVVLFVALAACKATMPFTDDETWEFLASKTLYEEGSPLAIDGGPHLHHPFGYYFLLGATMRCLGANELGARAFGIAATLACFFLARYVLRTLIGGRDALAELLLGVLYLLAPVVIQGSLVITADTMVHHVWAMTLIAYAVRRWPLAPRDFAVLGALCALGFWCKIVTPVLVTGALPLFFLLTRQWRRMLWAAAVTAGGGAALFLASWALYGHVAGIPWWAPFGYLLDVVRSRGAAASPAAKLLVVGRGGLGLLLWLGIPFALLALGAVVRYVRQTPRDPRCGLLLCIGLTLGICHTFVSGLPFGFPRYHFAMIPVWAILVTWHCAQSLREKPCSLKFGVAAGAVALAFYLLAAGDPLLALNRDLKLHALRMEELPAPSLAATALPMALAFVLPALVLAGSLHRRAVRWRVPLLLAAALASHAALDSRQASAGYHTGLAYGETGTRELIAHVNAALEPGRELIAGKDIVYHTAGRGYMHDWRWGEKDFLRARIESPVTQFVVMGLMHNTIEQLRTMRNDEDFPRALSRGYRLLRIGTYLVWERHEGP